MARSVKKGPFVDAHLAEESCGDERVSAETGNSDVVPPFDSDAGNGRSYDRRSQRAKIYPCLCYGKHGRA